MPSTSVIVFDKSNKQEDYKYVAEDAFGQSHVGYIYVQKPWYSPESAWTYYIRYEKYDLPSFCGGAESSGFKDYVVNKNTIRPYTQYERVRLDLKRGWNVRIVSGLGDGGMVIAQFAPGDSVPEDIWGSTI
jgi:hypothetical protein